MQKTHRRMLAVATVLIICLVLMAGCLSIPGPETRPTTAPPKEPATVPATLSVKTLAVTTVMTQPPATVAVSPTPAKVVAKVTRQGAYELRTCAEEGGVVAQPGQVCPGTWLAASDTFSCCSVMTVKAINRTTVIETGPLNLIIVMDDDLGPIVPT